MSDLLTPAEVCAWLKVPDSTLRTWMWRGVIPFIRLGPKTARFSRADLERWLAERRGGRAVTG